MTDKEIAAAGNALIGWFNSQEISPADAELVMSKVLAKLFDDKLGRGPHQPYALAKIVDAFTFQLVNDTNARTYHERRHK